MLAGAPKARGKVPQGGWVRDLQAKKKKGKIALYAILVALVMMMMSGLVELGVDREG